MPRGGTGYVVGDCSRCHDVVLTVATVTTGAVVATVTITDFGACPVRQKSADQSGRAGLDQRGGTGATFTLTWVECQPLWRGTKPPNVPIPIGTQAQADEFFGQGSELSRMFAAFFKNNFANEVWAGPLAEPEGGQAATGSIKIDIGPTEAGTLHLYIGGVHVPTNVAGGDTPAEVAVKIVDELDDRPELAVTAVVNATNT